MTFETLEVGQPGNVKINLIPFYELHHQRYTLYWNLLDEEAYKIFEDKEKDELERLRSVSVDVVQPGEQQPEIEHGIKSKHSYTGYSHYLQKSWRDCRGEGYFSYKMAVEPNKQMYLLVSYYGRDNAFFDNGENYDRDFEVLIDGKVIALQKLDGKLSDTLIDICYEIPNALTEGKQKVEVKFSSSEGKAAGGVYGVRVMNSPL